MWPDFPTLYWDVDMCVSRSASTSWDCEKSLGSLNFAHVIQVVVPDAYTLPDYVRNLLSTQRYQVVRNLSVKEFVAWDFLAAFVKRGSLFALSVNTDLSTGQCVAVTPDGKLRLTSQEDVFHSTGLEGTVRADSSKSHKVYESTVDLVRDCFYPGKKNYERVVQALTRAEVDFVCDVAFVWEPPSECRDISPLSVGEYFRRRGYSVDHCEPTYTFAQQFSLLVPKMAAILADGKTADDKLADGKTADDTVAGCVAAAANVVDDETLLQVREWLGAVVCGVNCRPPSDDAEEFVSSYRCPEPSEETGQLYVGQWSGYFSRLCVQRLLETIWQNLPKERFPFCGVVIHGFDDDPTRLLTERHSQLLARTPETSVVLLPDGRYCLFHSPKFVARRS